MLSFPSSPNKKQVPAMTQTPMAQALGSVWARTGPGIGVLFGLFAVLNARLLAVELCQPSHSPSFAGHNTGSRGIRQGLGQALICFFLRSTVFFGSWRA